MKRATILPAVFAGLMLAWASTAWGQTTVPHTFAPDTPANAAEVNDNFQALAAAIDAVQSAAVPEIVTQSIPASYAIETKFSPGDAAGSRNILVFAGFFDMSGGQFFSVRIGYTKTDGSGTRVMDEVELGYTFFDPMLPGTPFINFWEIRRQEFTQYNNTLDNTSAFSFLSTPAPLPATIPAAMGPAFETETISCQQPRVTNIRRECWIVRRENSTNSLTEVENFRVLERFATPAFPLFNAAGDLVLNPLFTFSNTLVLTIGSFGGLIVMAPNVGGVLESGFGDNDGGGGGVLVWSRIDGAVTGTLSGTPFVSGELAFNVFFQ